MATYHIMVRGYATNVDSIVLQCYSETCLKTTCVIRPPLLLRQQFSIILYIILYRHSLLRPQNFGPKGGLIKQVSLYYKRI